MIGRNWALFGAAALALALAGCGRSSREEAAAAYCPQPLTVQDASRLTRFKPGAGRDPRDVVYEAALVGTAVACSVKRGAMDVSLYMRVAVNAGPSVGAGVSSVPYFVRVIDSSGAVVQGREFYADFKLSQTNPRGLSQEELTLTLPFNQVAEVSGYRIAVGLKPTQEELDYNRRAQVRQ